MNSNGSQITLAIESAISGGSIAIFAGDLCVDGMVGPVGISRAEDLLPNIESLLLRNNVPTASIGSIIVGAGPGSFTGIRIGIATAMGLADALNIPIKQFSTLAAMALAAETIGTLTVCLPVGREMTCVQTFDTRTGNSLPLSEPSAMNNDEMAELMAAATPQTIVVNDSIFESMPADRQAKLINIGSDLASILARSASRLTPLDEPLFIGKRK